MKESSPSKSPQKSEISKTESPKKDIQSPESKEPGSPVTSPKKKEKVWLDDEYYPENHKEKTAKQLEIPKIFGKYSGCMGLESFKRYNIHYIDDHSIMTVAGNCYFIINLDTKEEKVFLGNDWGGVSSIAIHPNKKYYAVSEKGTFPNIYIYEFPSLKLYRILRKGTEKSYSNIEFSPTGTKLAAVGGEPDYLLSIWDWKQEKIILKFKAFSQDIFRVKFSPITDEVLFTSGTGHIRFWKMTSTFTGLKLQGDIGKFGTLELSDIAGFAELPSGKVASGTEYGTLIIWEGNLVKAHIQLEGKVPLHKGMIEVVLVQEKFLITAGGDGYIKWWDLDVIENGEADETFNFFMKPTNVKLIEHQDKTPAYIVSMIRGSNHWLIQDGKGKFFKLNAADLQYEEMMHFHSGKIGEVAIAPHFDVCVTAGFDGVVKLWDYTRQKEVYYTKYSGEALCVDWMPTNEVGKGRVIAVGFSTGIVRILLLDKNKFSILTAFKPHDSPVISIKYSPFGEKLVTLAKDGSIFFFDLTRDDLQKYDPLCLWEIKSNIHEIHWSFDSKILMVPSDDGCVMFLDSPDKLKIDNHASYIVVPEITKWKVRMMEFQMPKYQKKENEEEERRKRRFMHPKDLLKLKQKEEEEAEKEWDPAPVKAACFTSRDNYQFACFIEGPYQGFIYICEKESIRPLKAINYTYKELQITSLRMSLDFSIMVIGFINGSYFVKLMEDPSKSLEVNYHDFQTGRLRRVIMDRSNKFCLSTGEDGLLISIQIANNIIKEVLKPPESEEKIDPVFDFKPMGVELLKFEDGLQIYEKMDIDILDEKEYSLQVKKLREEEDNKLKIADQKKKKVTNEINQLRDDFNKIIDKYAKNPSFGSLKDDTKNVDNEYFQTLDKQVDDSIEDVKKQLAYDIEVQRVSMQKLKDKYYDILQNPIMIIKSFKSKSFVRTFRLPKMSEFLRQMIDEYTKISEEAKKQLEKQEQEAASEEASELITQEKEGGATKSQLTKTKIATKQAANEQGSGAKKSTTQLNKEQKKKEREMRRKQIEEHRRIKPHTPDSEKEGSGRARRSKSKKVIIDPKYQKKIEEADKMKGNYVLKASEEYIVPENEQKNAKIKRNEMILLQESLHNIKEQFNIRVIELRNKKSTITQRLIQLNKRVGEIKKELGLSEVLFEPQVLTLEEEPEKMWDISEKEIKKYVALKKQRELEEKTKKSIYGAKKVAEAKIIEDEEENSPKNEQKEESTITPFDRRGKKVQQSNLEDEIKNIRNIELKFEKSELMKEIHELIKSFDKEVEEEQNHRLILECDLKNAEAKFITYFDELMILNCLQDKDDELSSKLLRLKQDKNGITKELNEIAKKVQEKDNEISIHKMTIKELENSFDGLVSQDMPEYDQLHDFFMRKIKRRKKEKEEKKKEGENEEEEEEEEEENEESEDEDAIDEDEDAQLIMKLNQDDHKIEDIEKLREQRLDTEDKIKKIQKASHEFERQRKVLADKEADINKFLAVITSQINAFQKDKQKRLNRLEISFVLRLNQLQNLELNEEKRIIYEKESNSKQLNENEESPSDKMERSPESGSPFDNGQGMPEEEEPDFRGFYLPPDLEQSILFTNMQIKQLLDKKHELEEYCKKKEKNMKKMEMKKNQLKDETKKLETEKQSWMKKFDDARLLKFGETVDLDWIVTLDSSESFQAQQNKFNKLEKKLAQELKSAEERLEKTKRQLSEQVKKNTELLNEITKMGNQQKELVKTLEKSSKQIFDIDSEDQKAKLMQDREKIKQVLELQTERITVLKNEIELFKRKGGHIYTTISANRRVTGGIDPPEEESKAPT